MRWCGHNDDSNLGSLKGPAHASGTAAGERRWMVRLVVAVALVGALMAGAGESVGTVSSAAAARAPNGSPPMPFGHGQSCLLDGGLPGSGAILHTDFWLKTYGVSGNWSCQVATGGTHTSVTGDWVVPQVTDIAPIYVDYSATWIGIHRVTSQPLIQTGTAQESGRGWARQFASYDLLPGESRPIDHTVDPGNRITASVSEVNATTNSWRIESAGSTRYRRSTRSGERQT